MKLRKLILAIVTVLIFVGFSKAQTLSEKQKIEDFEYLYKILKENYPYFGVLEREQNIKWLDYKVDFEKAIKETKTDKEFKCLSKWQIEI